MSQNIERRHRDISNSSPFYVDIIIQENKVNAYDLEYNLHNHFKSNYIKNEWFNLTEIELNECLLKIKEWN